MTDNFKGTLPPPLIFFIFLALGLFLHWIMPVNMISQHEWLRYPVGGHFLLVSGAIAIQTYLLMRKNKTPLDFNKPTTSIITKGPFRFTRNPLYLSLLMLFLGIAILLNSLWFIPLFLCMFTFLNAIAKKEELYLEKSFGEEYSIYKKSVRRWL